MYKCASAKLAKQWQTGAIKAMDRLISRCEVRQCSQMQPGVLMGEKRCSRCYPVLLFHIIRRHSSDVYLGMSLIQNGSSYLMYPNASSKLAKR